MTVLETERLILKPLELADAPTTQRLFPHWEIVRYLTAKVPWPYPENGALEYYRDMALPSVARGEQWIWAIGLKGGPDHLIGAINLTVGREENRGFWLGLPWQRQGLMSEACEIVTDYWFDTLGQKVLKVSKAVANVASRRVSEKQGARLIGIEERHYVSGCLPAEIWELSREQWLARSR